MVEAYLSQFWRLRVQEQGKAHLVLGEDLIPSLQRPPSRVSSWPFLYVHAHSSSSCEATKCIVRALPAPHQPWSPPTISISSTVGFIR